MKRDVNCVLNCFLFINHLFISNLCLYTDLNPSISCSTPTTRIEIIIGNELNDITIKLLAAYKEYSNGRRGRNTMFISC